MVAVTPETHLPSFCQDSTGGGAGGGAPPSGWKTHTRVVVETSFPKHGEMQPTLGFRDLFPSGRPGTQVGGG